MFNLNDILQSAQGGQAIDNLARQFNLSPEQAQKAMQALAPAFSMGLQTKAQTPGGFTDVWNKLAEGPNHTAYDDPSAVSGGAAVSQGNDVLGTLFGSKDVSRQVALNAAQVSGVPASILKQMLPVIASMLIGGLFKNMTGGRSGGASTGTGGGLGDILGQMMGGAGQSGGAGGLGGGLGGILADMLGGAQGKPQPAPRGQPDPRMQPESQADTGGPMGGPLGGALGGPMGGILNDILGQMMGGSRQPAPQAQEDDGPSPQPGRGNPPPSSDPFQAQLDSLSQIFKSGVETSQSQQKGLQDIFSNMFGKR